VFVNGVVRLGFPFPNSKIRVPSYSHSVLMLGKNSTIKFEGDVYIEQGFQIALGENAELIFGGRNFINKNLTIICNNSMKIGRTVGVGWGVTLIDDDKHEMSTARGRLIRLPSRPLVIGDYAAIQSNVYIPAGVNIGEHSIISPNTLLRQDIPPKTLVYTDNKISMKNGLFSPLKKITD